MSNATFQQILHKIYGTFGRSLPGIDQQALMFERCRRIPDKAAAWIAERLCDEATLPANMGRALQRGWQDFMAANPEQTQKTAFCGHCEAGWIWCWREQGGKAQQFIAPCPTCRASAPTAKTRSALEHEGVIVMPHAYPGGPLAFDRDNAFGVLS